MITIRDIRFIRVIRGRKIGLELCSLIPALGFAASLVEELRSPILSPLHSESVSFVAERPLARLPVAFPVAFRNEMEKEIRKS